MGAVSGGYLLCFSGSLCRGPGRRGGSLWTRETPSRVCCRLMSPAPRTRERPCSKSIVACQSRTRPRHSLRGPRRFHRSRENRLGGRGGVRSEQRRGIDRRMRLRGEEKRARQWRGRQDEVCVWGGSGPQGQVLGFSGRGEGSVAQSLGSSRGVAGHGTGAPLGCAD